MQEIEKQSQKTTHRSPL